MRAFVAIFLLFAAASLVGPVLAQDVPMGRPPSSDLRTYRDPNAPKKKPGLAPQAYLLIAGLGCVTFLGMLVWFKHQARDLNLPEDESAMAALGGGGSPGAGLSPKEKIFSALGRAGGWATPGRVSMASGLDSSTAESALQALVQEGRVKAGRDKSGRVLYRVP